MKFSFEVAGKKKELLFEIGRFNISVGITRDDEPIKVILDLIEKKVRVQVTPDGVREGVRKSIESINKFLHNPEYAQKLDNINKKWEEWLTRKKEERAKKLIREYAKQERRTEEDILRDFFKGE